MYRVYDDRTNETLFSSKNNLDCALFITENIGEESDDFEHVWIEKCHVEDISDENTSPKC